MTELRVEAAVCQAFPELMVAAVVAEGVRAEGPREETERLLTGLEAAAAGGGWAPLAESDPLLASWQAAYRAFGTNPRRFRPSVDALCRRLAKSGRLPRINPAVDAYNAVSVLHAVPVGAFDLASVRGDIRLRFAVEGDAFSPLGEPAAVEETRPGEVVYVDDAAECAVLTRHWNHRDSDRTKVTPASRDVVFLLEAVAADPGHKTVAQAVERLAALLGAHAARVTTHRLTPAHPAARLR
jgi:DNA/RNA-binding domain of Phe-tRNA-synthetase-like protein